MSVLLVAVQRSLPLSDGNVLSAHPGHVSSLVVGSYFFGSRFIVQCLDHRARGLGVGNILKATILMTLRTNRSDVPLNMSSLVQLLGHRIRTERKFGGPHWTRRKNVQKESCVPALFQLL